MDKQPVRDAMERQLGAWAHLQSDDYAAQRILLLSCADALDLMMPQIRAGRVPPMQAVTASKALFALLRQLAPDAADPAAGSDWDVELPLFDE